jgi:hypothetical protein
MISRLVLSGVGDRIIISQSCQFDATEWRACVGQCVRISGMSRELFVRLTRSAVLVMAVETIMFLVVPLVSIATGAYPDMLINVGTVSHMLTLFLPQALAVALPAAVPVAVFLVCRRAPVTRRVGMTVGAFAIAGALATATLNVWAAPVTNATYRKLAFGHVDGRLVNGLRLNEPGGAGYRFQMRQRWSGPASVLVFAAVALAASLGRSSEVRRTRLPGFAG